MRLAVMTGGGDCPGLNAVIQAIVIQAFKYGYEIVGIKNGYEGLLNGEIERLSLETVDDIFKTGGTVLGTSRINPFKTESGSQQIVNVVERFAIDALIVIGGDDTLSVADKINRMGIPTVGVPKTIDNDLSATDYCVGFWTAVDTAAEAIEKLHTTAKSHSRIIIAEVMGRNAGWLTLMAGLAGGAHIILLPEQTFDIEYICEVVMKREAMGKSYTIIAVAEGAKPKDFEDFITVSKERDQYGHIRLGGIATILDKEIGKRTGKTTRSVILGHVQRGGSPNSFDKILGIRLGVFAVDLVREKKFGYAAILHGTEIVSVRLEKLVAELKIVKENLFQLTKIFSD